MFLSLQRSGMNIFFISALPPTAAHCEYFMSACKPMMTNSGDAHVACVCEKEEQFFFVCLATVAVLLVLTGASCKSCLFVGGSLNCLPETTYCSNQYDRIYRHHLYREIGFTTQFYATNMLYGNRQQAAKCKTTMEHSFFFFQKRLESTVTTFPCAIGDFYGILETHKNKCILSQQLPFQQVLTKLHAAAKSSSAATDS